MTQDDIIEMAKQVCDIAIDNRGRHTFVCDEYGLEAFAKLVAQHERERIKVANAPEIERINAHIKELEDAVLAEREACAKVCEEYADDSRTGITCAEVIRARGQA
jgi:hypothetical protein